MKSFVATFRVQDEIYACRKFTAPSLKEAVAQWVRSQEPKETLFSIIQNQNDD